MQLGRKMMEFDNISGIIESVLFATGEPVNIEKLAEILEIDIETTKNALDKMTKGYEAKKRGILLREINGSYQLCSKPENYHYIKRISEPRKQQELSKAAFEVLAVIAYNQPVTKAKIDSIRGVSCERAIQTLLERELICEAGRMEVSGRPILYQVTQEFFRCFGIKSINDLPILEIEEQKTKEVEDESITDINITLISDKVNK